MLVVLTNRRPLSTPSSSAPFPTGLLASDSQTASPPSCAPRRRATVRRYRRCHLACRSRARRPPCQQASSVRTTAAGPATTTATMEGRAQSTMRVDMVWTAPTAAHVSHPRHLLQQTLHPARRRRRHRRHRRRLHPHRRLLHRHLLHHRRSRHHHHRHRLRRRHPRRRRCRRRPDRRRRRHRHDHRRLLLPQARRSTSQRAASRCWTATSTAPRCSSAFSPATRAST
mmetsp:Transcript_25643/g.56174  ORF Transcript_25643/g.56174 Transcript_25643/m.56174 type:complete len:227 (-) Transcript_25643:1202-1882(-)